MRGNRRSFSWSFVLRFVTFVDRIFAALNRGAKPFRPHGLPTSRPLRPGLVALVLLRPAGQARAGHPGRPERLVREHAGAAQRGRAVGRLPARDPQPRHGARHDGGLPRGLGIDREHDEADRAAGRRIGVPLLFLWAARDDLDDLYGDPLAIWRDWADNVRGQPIDYGHHIAEEAPAELASHLIGFFAPA